MRKLVCFFYSEHKTNKWVWSETNFLVGLEEPHLATVKKQKLVWFVRHLGVWATPWWAEEMLDGQHHRVDIPLHARTADLGPLQKRPEEDLR